MKALDSWTVKRAADLGMTMLQYEAFVDLQRAYTRNEYEICQCEWDGDAYEDGTPYGYRCKPNPLCNQHRVEDWQEGREAIRRTLWTTPMYIAASGWHLISCCHWTYKLWSTQNSHSCGGWIELGSPLSAPLGALVRLDVPIKGRFVEVGG